MQSKPEVCFPGTCIGNTDSRHFTNVTKAIYRFNPLLLKSDDLPRYRILPACGQLFGVGTTGRENRSALGRRRKPSLVYLGVVVVLPHILLGHPFPAHLGAARIWDGDYPGRTLALAAFCFKSSISCCALSLGISKLGWLEEQVLQLRRTIWCMSLYFYVVHHFMKWARS